MKNWGEGGGSHGRKPTRSTAHQSLAWRHTVGVALMRGFGSWLSLPYWRLSGPCFLPIRKAPFLACPSGVRHEAWHLRGSESLGCFCCWPLPDSRSLVLRTLQASAAWRWRRERCRSRPSAGREDSQALPLASGYVSRTGSLPTSGEKNDVSVHKVRTRAARKAGSWGKPEVTGEGSEERSTRPGGRKTHFPELLEWRAGSEVRGPDSNQSGAGGRKC